MASNIPAEYDYINIYNGQIRPSTVHLADNQTAKLFEKYLIQEAMSVFTWEGMPEEWNYDFFRYCLLMLGHVAVFRSDQYGLIFMNGQPMGRGLWYQPTNYVVTNPLLRDIQRPEIGTDCEVIRLQPNWSGIGDLVTFYASMMALSAESAAINLQNSKLAYVFMAKDKAQAQSYKKLYDNIAAGDPAAVIDEKLFDADGNPRWMAFNQNLKETYITSDIMSDLHRWKNLFLTEIGIPNANFEKSERLLTNEINANNTETRSKADLWLEEMNKCCRKVNRMFGLDLSVHLTYPDVNPVDPDERPQEVDEDE